MKYSLPIILTGPMAAGKSSVATELAKLTGIPRVPMDRVRWCYYFQAGFSLEKESLLGSFAEAMAYWKPFEVEAVKKIITDFSQSIIDFGAGHSYFTEETQFNMVNSYLASVQNVLLLLPSNDKDESLVICNERLKIRTGKELDKNEIETNKQFIEHPSNYLLAKQIVYTKNETPQETALKVVSLLK